MRAAAERAHLRLSSGIATGLYWEGKSAFRGQIDVAMSGEEAEGEWRASGGCLRRRSGRSVMEDVNARGGGPLWRLFQLFAESRVGRLVRETLRGRVARGRKGEKNEWLETLGGREGTGAGPNLDPAPSPVSIFPSRWVFLFLDRP